MQKSDTDGTEAPPLNIYQRMIAAMEIVRYVQKDPAKPGTGQKYSTVSHDAVTAKCREALMKVGVYSYPEITATNHSAFKTMASEWVNNAKVPTEKEYFAVQIAMLMHFVNVDNPEDRFSVTSLGIGVDQVALQDKCPGKAFSYAVKYGYLKGMGLETGDDPDQEQDRGDEAAKDAPRTKQSAPARARAAEPKHADKAGPEGHPDEMPPPAQTESKAYTPAERIRAVIAEVARRTGDREAALKEDVKKWITEEFHITKASEYAALTSGRVNDIVTGIYQLWDKPQGKTEAGESE